ncbi:MAG: hypothetical protein ACKOWD_15255 [Rhodoferax sp.]
MNMNTTHFQKFQPVLRDAVAPKVRDPRLLIEQEGVVQVFYAPFEYINPTARIVLVGITPGPTQMVNANAEARRVLLSGGSQAEAIRIAKQVAAFSGEPMRSNLIKQLNHWGFHRWLGLSDASALFEGDQSLLQTTSLLRYPVFVEGEDYRGTPDMTKNSLLRKHLLAGFVEEVKALPNAVFVGLGPAVQKVLDKLVGERILPADRVIGGLLHPSGNCTYRINYLIGERKSPLPHATNPHTYDAGRSAFAVKYLAN